MKKVALILPSEFRRLAAHCGSLCAWHDFLPKPELIVGCSAGAIMGAGCIPWTKNNFEKIGELTKNLKTKQIYSIPKSIEALALLALSGSFVPFFDLKNLSKKQRFALRTAEIAAILSLDAFSFNQFLKRPSLFSNEPLRNLLTSAFDFEAIFNSSIKFEAISVDMEMSERFIITNYLEEDKNKERFVNGILASSKLSGRFPPIRIDGKFLGDAALLGNAPLDRAVLHNCDVAVIMAYAPFKERLDPPKVFMGDIIRAANITESELTRMQIENFILRKKIGENLPEIIVIEAEEPLPDLSFREFDSNGLIKSMNIGYSAVRSNLNKLESVLT